MSATLNLQKVEERTQEIGREMFARMRRNQPNILAFAWWQERMLQFCMLDEWFKVQAFRFIDVLPTMANDVDVARHLKEYFVLPEHARNGQAHGAHAPGGGQNSNAALQELERAPAGKGAVRLLSKMMNFRKLDSLPARLFAKSARWGSSIMAGSFVAGSNIAEAERAIRRLRGKRMAFTVDVLGEAAVSKEEAEVYLETYLTLIRELSPHAATWAPVPLVDEGDGRPIPRVNVSVKITSLFPGFDPIGGERTKARAKELLRPILRSGMENGCNIHIDMEDYAVKDLTLDVCEELFMEPEFRDYPHFGIVLQAYLKDGERDATRTIEYAKRRGTPIWVRLVKGAYWDSETVWAAQRHWPVPVWEQKWESDACYERMTRMLLSNYQHTHGAFAGHNIRSLSHAMAVRELLDVPHWAFELQMLYGMGDPIKFAALEMGQRCRIYTPYGNMLAGMAYLIRRLLENTANESFLRQSGSDDVDEATLLEDPNVTGQHATPPQPVTHSRFEFEEPVMDPFENVANTDFSLEASRRQMQAGLAQARTALGREVPLVVGGAPVTTGKWFETHNPCQPKEVVARIAQAEAGTVDQAVAAARQAYPEWRRTSVADRAALLERIAGRLQTRRFELAAWMVIEVAKTWREADAEVSEAIDYCNYYAKEIVRINSRPRRRDIEGETNEYAYQPRGVAAVLAPWNFPLALLANMVTAAVVTGNTVVMKPSSAAAAVGSKFMEVLAEAATPAGVVNFIAGPGAEVGEALVRHPGVATVAFTGSRQAGQHVYEVAAQAPCDRPGLKRVVADLGGKNAVIVDANADLDDAIKGIIASAFTYAGQRCSAAARVIVLEGAHDRLMERLVAGSRSKSVGPADDPTTAIPAVIDKAAFDQIRAQIAAGKRDAKCVLEVDTTSIIEETGGYFIGPHIFDDVPPNSPLAQEEIFGPVLTVLRAKDFDEALQIFNGTEYALTGGIYSRSPANLARARIECECGNLYINRPITGSRVDLQPYGGFKMSGLGAKAGGPDYLIQYCDAQTITENTLRRGFAPSEEAMGSLS